MTRFNTALFAALAIAALTAFARPAAAIEYPWCAQYGGSGRRRRTKLRLRELRAMHGNRPRSGRLLRAQFVLHWRRRAAHQAAAQAPERLTRVRRFARERMTGRPSMRKLCSVLFALAALAAPTVFAPSVGHADPYPWCAALRRRPKRRRPQLRLRHATSNAVVTIARHRRLLRAQPVLHRPGRAARQARPQAVTTTKTQQASLAFARVGRASDGAACAPARKPGHIARHGAASPFQSAQTMQDAVALHQQGRLREAEKLYARVLKAAPRQFRRAASARPRARRKAARWARPTG